MNDSFTPFREKMEGAEVNPAAIRAFERAFAGLTSGESGWMPEATLRPVLDLPRLEEFESEDDGSDDSGLLARSVMLKLNGGLGTGMGLEKAKSLLPVRGDETFLDLIVRQVLAARQTSDLRFLLLNSFSTSADTRAHLRHHPELGDPAALEMLQNKVPKILEDTRKPAVWPQDPTLEWCPPGHGDIYAALLGSGMLQRLIGEGILYLFVSNADNLGATLDPVLLRWFAASDKPFLMEVTARTAADRKGGHLAIRDSDGRLVLRESAQCPETDLSAFQDINRHRYFNTNNIWLRLDHLAESLERHGGLLPLPVIRNLKTIDPRDKKSPKVIQLETAMGAAIECFDGAGAVVVPRTRFAPVKTTADLLALRSDAYLITRDGRAVLAPERLGVPPEILLDPAHFKLVDQLDAALAGGVPSLLHCRRLEVRGPVRFSASDRFVGDVVLDG
jgi:UDP-N-acetylglucosamine pyrophosphorylase